MTTAQERRKQIEALEDLRGSRIICYVTSTRPNLDSPMAMDVIPVIYEHLRRIETPPKETTIELFLHSNGGEGVVPWRLVSLIRERCREFNVLIPNRAFSAATLTALGADHVIMHPMGMLGPIDPTVTNAFNPVNERNPAGPPLGISVEDVASYFALVREDVSIGHEDELIQALTALTNRVHPLALGNVKRPTQQSRMMGENLLKSRLAGELTAHQIREVIDKLTSQLYYHGHPISRKEARDEIGLPFVIDATEAEEDAMWDLFLNYRDVLSLEAVWDPTIEALKTLPAPIPVSQPVSQPGTPAFPGQQVYHDVLLPPLPTARVDSTERSDVFEQSFEVNVARRPDGSYTFGQIIRGVGWREEEAVVVADNAVPSEGAEVDDNSAGTKA